jgi:hypothetical protein
MPVAPQLQETQATRLAGKTGRRIDVGGCPCRIEPMYNGHLLGPTPRTKPTTKLRSDYWVPSGRCSVMVEPEPKSLLTLMLPPILISQFPCDSNT